MPEKVTLAVTVLLVLLCHINNLISTVTNNGTFPGTDSSRTVFYSKSTISTSDNTNNLVPNSKKKRKDYQCQKILP